MKCITRSKSSGGIRPPKPMVDGSLALQSKLIYEKVRQCLPIIASDLAHLSAVASLALSTAVGVFAVVILVRNGVMVAGRVQRVPAATQSFIPRTPLPISNCRWRLACAYLHSPKPRNHLSSPFSRCHGGPRTDAHIDPQSPSSHYIGARSACPFHTAKPRSCTLSGVVASAGLSDRRAYCIQRRLSSRRVFGA